MKTIDPMPGDFETRNTTLRMPFAASPHFWAVLLAGGDGVRLRGLTRRIAGDSRPKQFCRIVGNASLFEQTRARLKPLCSPDQQVFVLSRAHERYYIEHLRKHTGASLAQPVNCGTGVGIILAIIHILERDPHAVVGFFPCDHYYSDEDSFRLTIPCCRPWTFRATSWRIKHGGCWCYAIENRDGPTSEARIGSSRPWLDTPFSPEWFIRADKVSSNS